MSITTAALSAWLYIWRRSLRLFVSCWDVFHRNAAGRLLSGRYWFSSFIEFSKHSRSLRYRVQTVGCFMWQHESSTSFINIQGPSRWRRPCYTYVCNCAQFPPPLTFNGTHSNTRRLIVRYTRLRYVDHFLFVFFVLQFFAITCCCSLYDAGPFLPS